MFGSQRARFRLWPALALATSFLLHSLTANAETVDWTVWPLPGVVNVVDDKPTDGITMEAMALLMARLPDLQPQYRIANRLRQQKMMAEGENICSIPLFEREDSNEFAYFIPFMITTPIQAIIRRDDLDRFPLEDGFLSLARLIDETDLHGGLSAFRTYPDPLGAWLTEAAARKRVKNITGSQGGESLQLMVSHGRLDYIFEFSSISMAMRKGSHMREPLLALPILEDRNLVVSGIYCTRNAWGQRMAERLDHAIRELSAEPEALLELYVEGMPIETYLVFEQDIRAYYQERATRVLTFRE